MKWPWVQDPLYILLSRLWNICCKYSLEWPKWGYWIQFKGRVSCFGSICFPLHNLLIFNDRMNSLPLNVATTLEEILIIYFQAYDYLFNKTKNSYSRFDNRTESFMCNQSLKLPLNNLLNICTCVHLLGNISSHVNNTKSQSCNAEELNKLVK